MMDTKEKLLLNRLNKKYGNRYGIASFKIRLLNDVLTEKERTALDDMHKVGSAYLSKLSLGVEHFGQVQWIKHKARSYLDYNCEIMIIDSGYIIAFFLENAEVFLDRYLEDNSQTLNICIINRTQRKCIQTYLNEHDIEFCERDI